MVLCFRQMHIALHVSLTVHMHMMFLNLANVIKHRVCVITRCSQQCYAPNHCFLCRDFLVLDALLRARSETWMTLSLQQHRKDQRVRLASSFKKCEKVNSF